MKEVERNKVALYLFNILDTRLLVRQEKNAKTIENIQAL